MELSSFQSMGQLKQVSAQRPHRRALASTQDGAMLASWQQACNIIHRTDIHMPYPCSERKQSCRVYTV
eukprot:1327604-Amphidinium_carterae.2